jgi:hypothetical protein
MTDGKIATIFTKATGFMIDAEQPDLIGFARAIEQASRRVALEEAAIHLEDIGEEEGCMPEYKWAAAAIRALSQKDPQ